ncbi:hypothetical protein [Planobispora rosea]|uniref:hypothetical protein n=1 Tax=Planobispora rosea TaxID=35762 RepID=UPI00083B4956|nr:hypothetical protein [Planobispora rosea]
MTITAIRPAYPALTELAGGSPLGHLALTIDLGRPTYHGRTQVTVRPGVVDAEAIELFGYAHCHRLAWAMHQRTGWPFGVVEQDDLPGRWVHVGLLTPTGTFLDIHGLRPVAQVVADIRAEHGLDVRVRAVDTPEELFSIIASSGERTAEEWLAELCPLSAEVIAVFADVLITRTQEAGR